jgi:7,8-dihydropterin-6-yl-methyl-4-(beta-D-ribofuranosyl)aminobenzene 5'-phosphate synthase
MGNRRLIMDIKITTLSENTANMGYIAEWGLSLYIEVERLKILLDTGLSVSALHNAQLMGIDFNSIDFIVISHGHVDHTGGLRSILKCIHHDIKVIAHPDIFTAKYASREDGSVEYIGVPNTMEELENKGAIFTLTTEPFYITDSILTTGEVPMITPYEQIDRFLLEKDGNEFKPDKLADDLSLIIKTPYGLVIVAGCAHRGIINIVQHARNITGIQEIYSIIGGIHLIRSTIERRENTIADLKKINPEKLAVSHCTGFEASVRLMTEFGDSFINNNAGSILVMP